MSVVQETRTVKGSLASAWEAIADLRAVEDWHPNVAKVTILTERNRGIGAARRLEFHDGRSVVETVVEEAERSFTKVEMTEAAMMNSAFVTISTKERSADTTDVTFAIDYSLQYGPIGWLLDRVMMRGMFSKVFDTAMAGLSYHLETGKVVVDSVPE